MHELLAVCPPTPWQRGPHISPDLLQAHVVHRPNVQAHGMAARWRAKAKAKHWQKKKIRKGRCKDVRLAARNRQIYLR
jgi:hypothetical protein